MRNIKFNSGHLLNLIVFLSGFAALSCQLVWIKEFELFFGIHIFSVSAVFTAFMTGLAPGSIIFGKLADRVKNTLQHFAIIELILVVFAVFFRPLSGQWGNIYQLVAANIEFTTLNVNFLRFSFAYLFLIGLAILIGGSLPVFMKISIQKISTLGNRTAQLDDFSEIDIGNPLQLLARYIADAEILYCCS
jgi:spermidine synthase